MIQVHQLGVMVVADEHHERRSDAEHHEENCQDVRRGPPGRSSGHRRGRRNAALELRSISTALYLNEFGLRTVVFEKGHIGGEASSRNFGWVYSNALHLDSCRWRTWRRSSGSATGTGSAPTSPCGGVERSCCCPTTTSWLSSRSGSARQRHATPMRSTPASCAAEN